MAWVRICAWKRRPTRTISAGEIAAAFLATLVTLTLPAPVIAQAFPDIPGVISPLRVEPDRNGVNLTSGKITLDGPSLGIPAAPHLHFDKVQNSAPYMHGKITAGSPPTASYSVHTTGGSSEAFRCSDFDCTSVMLTGSTFTPLGINHQNGTYVQAGSGESYTFNNNSSTSISGSTTTVQSYASAIHYPDGETISFTYDSAGCGAGVTCYRPTQISSNRGYFISVTYQSSDIAQSGWGIPLRAALYASSAPSTALQSLTYNSTATTVTDIGGRVWNANGSNNQLGIAVEAISGGLQLPTEAANALSVSVASNAQLVGSVVRDGVNWTYAYTNPIGNQYSSYGEYYYTNITVTGPNGYSMSYAMDPTYQTYSDGYANVIKSSTDSLNRVTTYSHDPQMRVNRIALPEGNSVSIGYDSCGNILTKTSVAKPGSGLSNTNESAVYPSDQDCTLGVLQYRPSSTTDALGRVTSYAWNSAGQLTKELAPADSNGVQRLTYITYTNSPAGISRKSQVQVCNSSSTNISLAVCSGSAASHIEYTYAGDTDLPATVTQKDESTGAIRTATYTYDAAGRPTVIDGPLAGTDDAEYLQYDTYGRKMWEVGGRGANGVRAAKKYTYRDSDDKVTNVQTGTVACTSACDTAALTLTIAQQTDTAYDSRRYPIREKTYDGSTTYAVTDSSFLDRGLVDCTTVRMNLASLPAATATGACSLGTQGSNGADRITKKIYDNGGQLLQLSDGLGTNLERVERTYAYTNNGRVRSVLDAENNLSSYVYDGFDRLSQTLYPSLNKGVHDSNGSDYEQLTYDADGNITQRRVRSGALIGYTYDSLNRMTHKGGSAVLDRDYTYDVLGHLLTAKFTSGGEGITNTYDGFGELASTTSTMGGTAHTLSYQYDADGNRTQIVHPDGATFTTGYDALGKMTTARWGITPFLSVTYDSLGRRSKITLGTSLNSSTTYGYDGISRLTSLAQNFTTSTDGVTQTFAYNPASEMTTETRDNNIYAWPGSVAVNRPYTTNGLNQYTVAGSTSFTYDTNGNLTSDGSNTYGYDSENELTSVSGAHSATLSYDPLGRLWRVSYPSGTAQFVYDPGAGGGGSQMALEYNGANTLTGRYFWGPDGEPIVSDQGPLDCNNTRFLHLDIRGSMIAMNECSGARATVATYDEYGIPASTNARRIQYTGQEWIGEVGLYYYKSRFYSPTLGRFMQTDPIGYEGGTNIYEYAADDPIDAQDPTGNACGSNIEGYASVSCFDELSDGSDGATKAPTFTKALPSTTNSNSDGRQKQQFEPLNSIKLLRTSADQLQQLVDPNTIFVTGTRVAQADLPQPGPLGFLQWWWNQIRGGAQIQVDRARTVAQHCVTDNSDIAAADVRQGAAKGSVKGAAKGAIIGGLLGEVLDPAGGAIPGAASGAARGAVQGAAEGAIGSAVRQACSQ